MHKIRQYLNRVRQRSVKQILIGRTTKVTDHHRRLKTANRRLKTANWQEKSDFRKGQGTEHEKHHAQHIESKKVPEHAKRKLIPRLQDKEHEERVRHWEKVPKTVHGQQVSHQITRLMSTCIHQRAIIKEQRRLEDHRLNQQGIWVQSYNRDTE